MFPFFVLLDTESVFYSCRLHESFDNDIFKFRLFVTNHGLSLESIVFRFDPFYVNLLHIALKLLDDHVVIPFNIFNLVRLTSFTIMQQ